MIEFRILLVLIVFLNLPLQMVQASSSGPIVVQNIDSDYELENGSRTRDYHLHIPQGIQKQEKVPLIIALHGGAEDWKAVRHKSGLDAKADQYGFMVAYPEGTGHVKMFGFWNAMDCCGYALNHNIDDVGFMKKLIDHLVENFSVDPSRVYVAGFSNGGMLAYRLACEIPDKIAAIAVVSGSMSGREMAPTKPVSVLIIHGMEDKLVPYGGGTGKWAKWGYPVNKESVIFASDFWRKINGCLDIPVCIDRDPLHIKLYQAGSTGAEVEIITIDEAKHAWPGGKTSFLRRAKPYPDLDATDECWKFFQRQKRQ